MFLLNYAKKKIKNWAKDPKNLRDAVKFLVPILVALLGKRLDDGTAKKLNEINEKI